MWPWTTYSCSKCNRPQVGQIQLASLHMQAREGLTLDRSSVVVKTRAEGAATKPNNGNKHERQAAKHLTISPNDDDPPPTKIHDGHKHSRKTFTPMMRRKNWSKDDAHSTAMAA